MGLLSHEQMRDFITTNHFRTPEDIQAALKGLFADTLQAELDTNLGCAKHAAGAKPTANRRNGRFLKQGLAPFRNSVRREAEGVS